MTFLMGHVQGQCRTCYAFFRSREGREDGAFCAHRVVQGDRRRLPLLAFRTFALRAELDAEALRGLTEPLGCTPEWDASALCTPPGGPARWHSLLEDLREEVTALWEGAPCTVYAAGVVLAPALAHYCLLGKAMRLAALPLRARLSVSKHGRVVPALGDETVLWDDGLEALRELFARGRACPEQPLGPNIRIDSMADYSWYVGWTGASPVSTIPSEVSVASLLESIGAPHAEGSPPLGASDKALLMRLALPELRAEVEAHIAQALEGLLGPGVRLQLRAGRRTLGGPSDMGDLCAAVLLPPPPNSVSPSHSHSNSRPGSPLVLSSAEVGSAPSCASKGHAMQPRAVGPPWEGGSGEPALEAPCAEAPVRARRIPYAALLQATQGWADALKLGEGGSAVVYKGVAPDGQTWAVKRGKKGALSPTQRKDFEKEVRH